jgi:hypothetical protein
MDGGRGGFVWLLVSRNIILDTGFNPVNIVLKILFPKYCGTQELIDNSIILVWTETILQFRCSRFNPYFMFIISMDLYTMTIIVFHELLVCYGSLTNSTRSVLILFQ